MLKGALRKWPRVLLLTALATESLGSSSAPEGLPDAAAYDSPTLTPDDKAQLSEALRLQKALGDQVWPGLARARIPVILYNSRYEFLVGAKKAPGAWTLVASDDFAGEKYYRRNASSPQAFAVELGAQWVASMTAFDWMNHRSPIKVSREFHVVAILHEMFHAYQATRCERRFKTALGTYAVEADYPAQDPQFAAGWDREGYLLAAALRATDEVAARRLAAEFLQAREKRRAQCRLSSDLLAYERELEWLEGLGKYAEIRFYELAASHRDDPAYAKYRPGLPYWQPNFFLLERQLSRQGGDLRFYLSGMAQARLLDRFDPGWKTAALGRRVYLEDLLRASSGADEK